MTIDRRQINDDRRRVFGSRQTLIAFVCECADDGCARTVALSPDDYERVRGSAPGLILHSSHDGDAIVRAS